MTFLLAAVLIAQILDAGTFAIWYRQYGSLGEINPLIVALVGAFGLLGMFVVKIGIGLLFALVANLDRRNRHMRVLVVLATLVGAFGAASNIYALILVHG